MNVSKAIVYFTRLAYSELPEIKRKYETLLDSLPSFRKDKILQYVKLEDRLRSFYIWKLLERTMRDVFSLDVNRESVSIDSYRKPFLTDRNDIHFNLSHSDEIVCCIVDKYPVGIDVERILPVDLSIASSFFSKRECSDLFNQPSREQIGYFYKLWTLKESYIKAEGRGLSIPLDSFAFELEDVLKFNGANGFKWDFALYSVNTEKQKSQMGCCVFKSRLPDKIIEISYRDL